MRRRELAQPHAAERAGIAVVKRALEDVGIRKPVIELDHGGKLSLRGNEKYALRKHNAPVERHPSLDFVVVALNLVYHADLPELSGEVVAAVDYDARFGLPLYGVCARLVESGHHRPVRGIDGLCGILHV